jgi:3-phenylpropionate/cinnamic acid dioxygenase small subunit
MARPERRDKRCDVETWELVAREQIRDLVAGYAHCADSGRFDELVALFAEDGVLETPDGQEHRGHDGIRDFLSGTKAQLAAAVLGAPLIRHHVSNLRIAVAGPDAATGAAYFFVITERGPDHWGRYRDRYVRIGGAWRFAHRRVRLDGREAQRER